MAILGRQTLQKKLKGSRSFHLPSHFRHLPVPSLRHACISSTAIANLPSRTKKIKVLFCFIASFLSFLSLLYPCIFTTHAPISTIMCGLTFVSLVFCEDCYPLGVKLHCAKLWDYTGWNRLCCPKVKKRSIQFSNTGSSSYMWVRHPWIW